MSKYWRACRSILIVLQRWCTGEVRLGWSGRARETSDRMTHEYHQLLYSIMMLTNSVIVTITIIVTIAVVTVMIVYRLIFFIISQYGTLFKVCHGGLLSCLGNSDNTCTKTTYVHTYIRIYVPAGSLKYWGDPNLRACRLTCWHKCW